MLCLLNPRRGDELGPQRLFWQGSSLTIPGSALGQHAGVRLACLRRPRESLLEYLYLKLGRHCSELLEILAQRVSLLRTSSNLLSCSP